MHKWSLLTFLVIGCAASGPDGQTNRGGASGSGPAGSGGGAVGSGGSIGAAGTGGSIGAAGTGGSSGSGLGGMSSAAGSGGTSAMAGATGQAGTGGGGQSTGGAGRGGGGGLAGSGGGGRGAAAGGGAGGDAAGGSAGGVAETIHFYGRWNQLADRAITVNTGSHVVAQFSGTGVSARFDTSGNKAPLPTLAWRVDQGTWQEGESAAKVTLGTGLPARTHEVTLMVRGVNEFDTRWTPPLISSITFLGLDVTGGALQPSPRPVRPKVEFLGDSITEGLYIWSSHNGQTTVPWRADAPLSYACLTAQNLGAEWRQVGFGAQGVLKGGSGGVPLANDAFNWIYKGVARDSWQPDLVVVNQGTNDGGASATSFRPAYATYMGTIRAGYPAAKIAAMRPFNGAHAAEIKAEVDARRTAGDSRIFYIDTSGWLGGSDTSDGTHPNQQGSQKAATALTAAIHSMALL